MGTPLWVNCCFSLAAVNICSSCLIFINLINICLLDELLSINVPWSQIFINLINICLLDELLSINVPWSQEFSGLLKFWI